MIPRDKVGQAKRWAEFHWTSISSDVPEGSFSELRIHPSGRVAAAISHRKVGCSFSGTAPRKSGPCGIVPQDHGLCWNHLAASSRQAETLERGASRSSTDVRHNDQFKNRDTGEANLTFLDLAYCFRGTEIPLLAHNFSKRASAIRRPSQDELLGTLCLGS